MLDNTQSIICAFGLASAASRSPYRHLELCGIALDYRPVGYVVSAEGKKITQSKHHSKAKGCLKKAGEGSGRRIGLAPAIKSVQQLRKFRHTIAARAIALASKALLNEHKKGNAKLRL